tara:strand:+ start:51 stop:443 length:393 start_codon:yes stop_codon:yes gene_type:complete
MPTKKKRVGFIPRDDVMIIINKLSFDNNLSNSKIIGILVEEALIKRGIINLKSSNEININTNNKSHINKAGINNDDFELLTETKLENNTIKYNDKKHPRFDLQTYEKFILFLEFQDMINRYGVNKKNVDK